MFSYLIPSDLENKIKVGIRVSIPFGNKILEGFDLEILDEKEQCDYNLKEIKDIVDENPVLNEEMIELGKYMSETYLAPLISCYQVMLPVALKAKKKVNIGIKEEKYITLNKEEYEIEEWIEKLKSQKQKDILLTLLEDNYLKKSDIEFLSSLKSLINKGLVKEEKKEVYRLKDNIDKKRSSFKLTGEQEYVINEIINGKDNIYLLHGVTGSGKTEVYINIIKDVIKHHKTAIVLVPEISLTTQLVDNFRSHFGGKVAILHSRLSDGERYDEWRKIIREEVSIVIGARSAVFAPLKNIGVIIVDEEHEATYKQENNPRYNAKDIAIYRANIHNAKVILGSATPSLESYARAKKGIYKFLELKNRINEYPLPKVTIVDMKDSIKKGNYLFSKELLSKIEDRISKHEQIMILLNRRGYSHYLTCKNCGYTYKCPNCDITLTYHKTSDTMRCHYCGYADKRHDICPNCKNKDFSILGTGTEKIEEELIKLFPTIRVVRMDLDTTSTKGSHDKI
jgi:primosomal protein N' (replication factor Y)